MGLISKLLKTGLTIGALVTAYQATQKTKKETGTVDADAFVRNFKDQAIENTKIVAVADLMPEKAKACAAEERAAIRAEGRKDSCFVKKMTKEEERIFG